LQGLSLEVQAHLNLDFTRSNVLEIYDNKLTGGIVGDIIDADCKRRCLIEQADIFSIPMQQTVAIGDGANDLPMIYAAGLGIAFHAKPTVQEQADVAINHGGLDKVLHFLR